MSGTPALSAPSLRLAGHIGQATLDWVAASGTGALADLDQHAAAVREALADSRVAVGRRAAAVAASAAVDARMAAAGCGGLVELLAAMERGCPDVAFADDAPGAEAATLPLLLHYVCGFLDEAVIRDWWPGTDRQAVPDWESMRLAAVCRLISAAESATKLHPQL